MSVRKAYWTSEEAVPSIARRFGITPDEVEGLGQWRLYPHDSVPKWASPGKPRAMKRPSIMDLFALPPEPPPSNGGRVAARVGASGERAAGAAPTPQDAPAPQAATQRDATTPQDAPMSQAAPDGRDSAPDGLTDADIVELRETYVSEPGILDSIAEAFEVPRERVIRILRGEERADAGGPIYRSLDVEALIL